MNQAKLLVSIIFLNLSISYLRFGLAPTSFGGRAARAVALGLVRKRTSSRVIRALANFFSVVLFYLVGDLPIVLLVLVGDLPIVLLVPLPAFIPTMQKTDGNGNFECFKCKTVNRLEMEG